ncbi:MAG: hypothetical protein ACI8R4_001823 [Paracoccaceae bacterium]
MGKNAIILGFEIMLGAVTFGMNPKWAANNWLLIFVVGGAIMLIGFVQGQRPFRCMFGLENTWLPLDQARKVFRDNIKTNGEIAGIIDFWDDPNGYFLAYVRDGMDSGWPLTVTGIHVGGEKRRALPLPIKNGSIDETNHSDAIVAADDLKYSDLQFDKRSITEFAKRWKAVEENDELKKRAPEQ